MSFDLTSLFSRQHGGVQALGDDDGDGVDVVPDLRRGWTSQGCPQPRLWSRKQCRRGIGNSSGRQDHLVHRKYRRWTKDRITCW